MPDPGALARVYGPESWDLYQRLDVTLAPRSPDWLTALASTLLRPGDLVIDAGCRDGAHLVQLVEQNEVTGVGIDPVAPAIARGTELVQQKGLAGRVTLRCGVVEDLPYPDRHFDFVWCRDVLELIDDLDLALAELVRVMKAGAPMVVFTDVATELLDERDAEMFDRDELGPRLRNLDEARLSSSFHRAGLTLQRREPISTEWREYREEREPIVSRKLLQLARLRRRRADFVAEHGRDMCDHVEANLHWELFEFLGKLLPVVYVLRREG